MGAAFDDTAASVAISRLQAAYGDVVTRRRWDELAALFEPDAPVRIDTVTRPALDLTGPGEVGAFIAGAVDRFELFEFVLLNAVVDVTAEDAATGRVWIAEIRQERDGGPFSNAFGVYTDRYARRDGRWRFAARSYRSLARLTAPTRAEVLPFPFADGA